MSLIRPLAPGPVDIIGDVHGELEALERLLQTLGYRGTQAPQGRRLVFLGDLVDRGPDSLGVVRRVRELVDAGVAECLLGNHELNLMRDQQRRQGTSWFYGEEETMGPGGPELPTQKASAKDRDELLEFFSTLPLALEREDLRLVHACWNEDAIDTLRGERDALTLWRQYARDTAAALHSEGVYERAREEEQQHPLHQPTQPPPLLPNVAERELRQQMENPLQVLCSGPEARVETPFWSGGKWRMVGRQPWWQQYRGPLAVVGHYWRKAPPAVVRRPTRSLFTGEPPYAWLGAGDVHCVDYSVGQRFRDRLMKRPMGGQLAALRVQDQRYTLVFSDRRIRLSSPRTSPASAG